MLRRAPSTISILGVTLVSRPPPTAASALIFYPPPVSDKSDASRLSSQWRQYGFKRDQILAPGKTLFRPFKKSLSPVLPLYSSAGLPVSPLELSLSSSCRRQPANFFLRAFFVAPGPLHGSSTTSAGAACGSGLTLDAASRFRDLRALIDEMKVTLLLHDSKEFDVGNQCDEEEDDREWLLRLLEDVMRTVQRLAERDTAVLSVRTTLLLRATVPHLV